VPPAAPATLRTAPGPRPRFPLGVLPELRKDPLAFFLRMQREHGDVVRLPVGPRHVHALFHPEAVRRVLQDNARNYTKQTRGFDAVRMLLGQGLLTSEGDFWLRQRRLAQPAFHRQRIAGFARTMAESAAALADAWAAELEAAGPGGPGPVVDVGHAMVRLTLRIAGLTLFSTDVSAGAAEFGRALGVALAYANARINQPLALPRSVPTPANRRAEKAAAVLDGVVRGIITRRRQEGGPPDDLLALLMEAVDEESGQRMSDTQLRDEVMTLLLAGHETTANGLCWAWVLLSRHPDVRRRLEAELASVLGGRAPSFEDLPRLVYTRQVVDEVLRLYPPAWIFSRSPSADDQAQGFRLEAGAYVLMSPWVTHRHPGLWENPEGFDPERFAPERAAALPRFAYFPFGGGPRQCIGNTFALVEMTLVLAALCQRFRLELVPGVPVEPEPTITLRPRDGLRMRLSAAR
jgi:cytochrome P450